MNAMKKMIVAAAVAVVGFAAVAAEASSSETYSFTYQACLRDEHGEPIKKENGQVQRNQKVTIRLWGDAASTEKPLWARKYAVYTDETGLFNLEVSDSTSDDKGEADGYGTPQYDSLAAALTSRPAGQVYIGLFVEGSAGEIVPRQRLFAVPYAAVANDVRAITKDIAVGGKIQFGTKSDGLVLSKAGIEQSGAASSSTFKTVQADVVRVSTISSEGQTVTVDKSLDITGNATMEKDATVNGNLTVKGVIDGDLKANGAINVAKNLKVEGTITDADGSEVVPVPVGGIIMWTKSTLPEPVDHWAICDGSKKNGVQTPNLRDRFIVGAGSSYGVGATGGESSVALKSSEMPSHAHIYVSDEVIFHQRGNIFNRVVDEEENMHTEYNNRGSEILRDQGVHIGGNCSFDPYRDSKNKMYLFKTGTAGGGSTDKVTKDEGTVMAHENRPPYYALYYIMRVK